MSNYYQVAQIGKGRYRIFDRWEFSQTCLWEEKEHFYGTPPMDSVI